MGAEGLRLKEKGAAEGQGSEACLSRQEPASGRIQGAEGHLSGASLWEGGGGGLLALSEIGSLCKLQAC